MALPIHVPELFSGEVVEWERVEFKQGWNPEAAMHTLCAFANDLHNWGGGYLVVGVEEKDGRPVMPPVGLSPGQLDAIQKDVLRISNRITPAYHPVVQPEIVNGKHVLIIWAPGGQNRPYRAPRSLSKADRDYEYYVRAGSSTIRARGVVESELLQLTANVPFDDRTRHDASLSDLSLRLIQAHLQEVRSDLLEAGRKMEFSALCARMQIVDGPPESLHPRNVGLLFFNEEPRRFFPQVQIDVVYFPQGRTGEIREQQFTGPLSMQLREALAFIRRSFIVEQVRKRPDRAEADRFVPFPYAAVEEALANAVYHRGYDVREPIEVQVTPEEMTVTSYPGPDPSVRIDDLNAGGVVARRYRNRRIGEFLKELRLTEGRGTGVPTMFRAMRDNGSPSPRFRTDEERSYFMVTLPIHPLALGDPAPLAEITESLKLDASLRHVLTACLEPQSRADLQARFSASDPTSFRRRYLQPLLRAGLLALTVPQAPRAPNQRYVTTASGRHLLESTSSQPASAQSA